MMDLTAVIVASAFAVSYTLTDLATKCLYVLGLRSGREAREAAGIARYRRRLEKRRAKDHRGRDRANSGSGASH